MNRTKTTTMIAAAVAVTLGLSAATAQNSTADAEVALEREQQRNASQERMQEMRDDASEPMSPEQAKKADKEFVKWASDGHLFAIQAADVVIQNTDDEFVKDFAKVLKRDHEQGLELLKQAASEAGYDVADEIQYDVVKDKLENLKDAKGTPEFEDKYVFGSFGSAAESTLWYAKTMNQTQSQPIEQYASTVLPLIQTHGQAVQQVAGLLITGDAPQAGGPDDAARPASGRLGGEAQGTDGDTTTGSDAASQPTPDNGMNDDIDEAIGTDADGDTDQADRDASVKIETPTDD